jgi:hypothetical protein
MAGKKSSEKKEDPSHDTSDISSEDWASIMKEAQIPKGDARYISDPNDPRALALSQNPEFLSMMEQIQKRDKRIREKRSPELETSEEHRVNVREILARIQKEFDIETSLFSPTEIKPSTTPVPAKDRSQKKSFEAFFEEGIQNVNDSDNLAPAAKAALIKQMERTAAIGDAVPQKKEETVEILPSEEPLLDRVLQAEERVKKRDRKIEAIKEALETLNAEIVATIPEKERHFYSTIDQSVPKLLEMIKNGKLQRKEADTAIKELREVLGKVKGPTEAGIANLFKVLDKEFPDPFEAGQLSKKSKVNTLQKVLIEAGEKRARIVSESPISAELLDFRLMAEVLDLVMFANNYLLNNAVGNLNLERGSILGAKEKLEELGMKPAKVDHLISTTQSKFIGKYMDVKKVRDENTGFKNHIGVLEKKLEELEATQGEPADRAKLNEILEGISIALKATGYDNVIFPEYSSITSSQEIDLNDVLNKIKDGITKAAISIAESNEDVEVKRKRIADLKRKLAKKTQTLIMDPTFRKVYKKFKVARDILKKCAAAYQKEVLPVETFPEVSFREEGAILQVAENYLGILEKLRLVAQFDLAVAEKSATEEFTNLIDKIPSRFRNGKNIMQIRKGIEELVEDEQEKIKFASVNTGRNILKILKAGQIDEKALLERTGYEKLDVGCVASYVNPLYKRVQSLESISARQNQLADKYAYKTFSDLKQEVEELNEKVEKGKAFVPKACKIASWGKEKVKRKRSDAAEFVKRLYAEIHELDKTEEQIKAEQEKIFRGCIIPGITSYQGFKKWLYKAHKQLKPMGNPAKDREKLVKLVHEIDPTQERDYHDSVVYLRAFVSHEVFKGIDAHLGYFDGLKASLKTDFASGQELVEILDQEITKTKKYIKSKDREIRDAGELLPNGDE